MEVNVVSVRLPHPLFTTAFSSNPQLKLRVVSDHKYITRSCDEATPVLLVTFDVLQIWFSATNSPGVGTKLAVVGPYPFIRVLLCMCDQFLDLGTRGVQ